VSVYNVEGTSESDEGALESESSDDGGIYVGMDLMTLFFIGYDPDCDGPPEHKKCHPTEF